jgi:hypothetical protein
MAEHGRDKADKKTKGIPILLPSWIKNEEWISIALYQSCSRCYPIIKSKGK